LAVEIDLALERVEALLREGDEGAGPGEAPELDPRAVEMPAVHDVVIGGEHLGETTVGVVVKIDDLPGGNALLLTGERLRRQVKTALRENILRGRHRFHHLIIETPLVKV